MAFDDPLVWVLIAAVIIFLFGSSKIPALARSLGQARREFDGAFRGQLNNNSSAPLENKNPHTAESSDSLIQAAEKEGIDTKGKTREQIASELAWKLKNH
jgi:sec-independent protein translocase protein TatA